MSKRVHTLTEKEKQALRLLVTGHDAKSIARHLNLSVHTINERLREARRKLAVSSSREAARQLHQVEAATPEFSASALLGDARHTHAVAAAAMPAGWAHRSGHTGWIVGAIIMSIALTFFAAMSLYGPAASPALSPNAAVMTAAASPATAVQSGAVTAARAWMALVDAGNWQASWSATSRSFQSLNTPERWAEVAASVQGPLGPVIRHELIGEEAVPAPPHGYQLVRFRSQYANRADAIVTLTLEQEDGRWVVSGIYIE